MLRHSVPHFPNKRRILNALRVEWRSSTPLFASTLERRNVNINFKKYLIFSSGDRTHHRRVTVTPLCPWATTASELLTIVNILKAQRKGFYVVLIKISFTLYHAHSRVKIKIDSSVKTLRFSFSAEFWRHCVLSSGT